ncbi:peptidylprolyl isomerase [Flavitalea antarctica]
MMTPTKLLAFAFITTLSANVTAQTLFTYGTTAVSKEEFLKAYSKNNAGQPGTPQSYREYLDLYTKFKVKVKAAKDLRLDTLSSQKAELQGFKSQVAESYMNDDATTNQLVREAFERGRKEIHLAHIYVPVSQEANETDLAAANNRIRSAYDRLTKGESFEAVALSVSADPSVQSNKGDVGYITALSLSYELENLAYSTAAGEFSKPYKGKTGFHIFKNLGERPASGRMRAAQILLAFTPGATEEQKQQQKKLADSLYNVIQSGGDFKTLAARFSNDNLSYQSGGEMMEFGIGRYEPAFENAAYSLAKDGDVSKPVLTSFGYHIIRRLELKPAPDSLPEGANYDAFKQLVTQSDRMETARQAQLLRIREQLGFKKGSYSEATLWRITDTLMRGRPLPANTGLNANTILFTYKDKKVLLKDWQDHIVRSLSLRSSLSRKAMFQEFADQKVLDYYREHLEEYNKDFAFQVSEFKEGNLLFEVMQRKIWDKAAADSIGLRKYFDKYKSKYKWEASADAIIFTFANAEQAMQMRSRIDSNWKAWSTLQETSNGNMQADSARFELSQIPVPDRTNFQPGLLTADTKNATDNSVSYSYIIRMYPANEQRSFAAARGFVVNDYQAFLEENWIKELMKKYPVKINEAVLSSL